MIKRAVFWAILLVSTLGAIELAARWAYGAASESAFDADEIEAAQRALQTEAESAPRAGLLGGLEVIHPYLGFVGNPTARNKLIDTLRETAVSDYGLNDDKSPIQRASEDRLIVGIFGGSVAHYLSTQGLTALDAELGRARRFAGRERVIVRVALAGWKQPQQLMALNYLLMLGAHFDVLINLDGFNEIALPPVENQPKGVFPYFPRNWYTRTQGASDQKVRAAVGKIAYLREQRARWAGRFTDPSSERSASWARTGLAAWVWRVRDDSLAAALADARLQMVASRAADTRYVAAGPPYDYEDEDLYTDLADAWARSSLQMHQLAEANGIEYYHFLQPNQYVPGSKPLHEQERRLAWSENSLYRKAVERGYPLLIAKGLELQQRGVAYTDLTQIFRENDSFLYVDVCCHLNADGNQLLGERIGQIISGSAPATGQPLSGAESGRAELRRD
ncbi:MAG: hypothetical protein VCE43_16740 [Myxococcota bacterium]